MKQEPAPSAELVMRVHRATRVPVMECRAYLNTFPANERERMVRELEQRKRFVHPPYWRYD